MGSKKKANKMHFRRRSLERVGAIVDESKIVRMIQTQQLEFVYRHSNNRTVYRYEFMDKFYRVVYDKERKQIITIYPENEK